MPNRSIAAALTLADRISRYSYKPGWTIRVGHREGHDGDWLLIRCATVDAYDPSRRLTLPGGRRITRAVEAMDDEQLTAWVLGLIDDIERHERDEWFRRDGVLVNDPHRKDER
jgi:hypothetical protein